ncbi:transglycosylase SLT domain-containing protein [Kineococcus rubinsiae]|uniref:transglycosylase SLT domain-containing protein n=1 Tax=Kineococcus rubinsiae TaxID=2609562 RepID=UPI0014310F85|nr:transglycosylase SLT domain-containing protein [Kineococcus rubinsiae]NIZ93660.1 transglycosylase SLT domain-containing protein [Kineococcus rubinsiae]
MSPVAEVQARIAEIQDRIASFSAGNPYARPVALTAAAPAATPAATATGTSGDFASVLSSSGGSVVRGPRTVDPAYGVPTTTGEQLLTTAKKYLGLPYLWGGTNPDKGLDCSGLIQTSAKELGITLPRTAAQQAKVGVEVRGGLAHAKPGDLVVLENGHHIGIYVGNGQMLHAPKTGDVVKISKVWETPMTIRRLGTTAATAAAGAGLAATALLTGVSGSSASDYVRPAGLTSPVAATSRSAPYDAAFTAAERKYGLPAGLLSAVAKQESGYDATATSPAGALGLMQFMPGTAKGMGIDPMNPAQAIDGAGKLLSSHVKTFGTVPLALAAYNAGPGNVRKYGGIPPFTETQNYVKKITASLGGLA